MSILTLVITFLGSLFKPHRQLRLENLALRQQVAMLRQSVKRPRATAADRVFFGKRDFNKRKESTKQPDALDNPTPIIHPNPFHHITTVEYVRSVGCIWGFYPRHRPPFIPDSAKCLPANFEGVSYRPDPASSKPRHHGKTSMSSRRAPISGAFWPRVVPAPCHGRFAHQQAVWSREEPGWGITLDDRFTPDTGRLEIEILRDERIVRTYFLPVGLHWSEGLLSTFKAEPHGS